MAGKSVRRDLRIPWVFAPTQVNLNRDTGLLKLIAMLTMLIDHAGKMLFPQYMFFRLIGRIAFPIYAYCIAAGCVYTRNPLNYLRRVVGVALISQPLYALALAHMVPGMTAISFAEKPVQAALNFYIQSWTGKPSILLSLALGIILLWSLRERQLVFTAAAAVCIYLLRNKLDYGLNGIGLILLFYLFCQYKWVSLPIVLSYMVWWGLQGSGYSAFGIRFSSQMFAIAALPLIYIQSKSRIRIPKWLGYTYYPLHLILIWALDKYVFL